MLLVGVLYEFQIICQIYKIYNNIINKILPNINYNRLFNLLKYVKIACSIINY